MTGAQQFIELRNTTVGKYFWGYKTYRRYYQTNNSRVNN